MNVIIFNPNVFCIGESYSVSSRYEHTFIGKCVEVKDNLIIFETPYGKIPITPGMVVSDDYRFERINIAKKFTEMQTTCQKSAANDVLEEQGLLGYHEAVVKGDIPHEE
jgi:hypothetical protein